MKTPHLKNVKTETKKKLKTKSTRKNKNKNSTITKNLLKKFEYAKSNKKNLKQIFENFELTADENNLEKEENKTYLSLTNEEIFNEISNKVNRYKQMINFNEELNNQYENEVKQFINYFMNFFNELTKNEDMNFNKIKESLFRAEQIIFNNSNVLMTVDENFKNSLSSFFDFLNQNLNSPNTTENFNFSNDRIIELIEKIKIFSTQLKENKNNFECNYKKNENDDENILEKNAEENSVKMNNLHSNFSQLARNKLKNSYRKRKKLLETVNINKSKKIYYEGDEINQNQKLFDDDQSQSVSTENINLKKIIEKTKKVFLRNFLQIYLIKENGLFSESYFSKVDRNCLSAYKNFKFYEIKFYFNLLEETEAISTYIFEIRKLFTCHIMIYNPIIDTSNKKKKFTKIMISGVGKKQSSLKRNLINFMSAEVKLDCLIKISLFSNIYDCMKKSLNKSFVKENLLFYTNIKDTLLNNLIKKIKIDSDK